MPPDKVVPRVVKLAFFLLIALPFVDAFSYELTVLSTRGIPIQEENGVTYRMLAKECIAGSCSTMGINPLSMVKNALFTTDDLSADESVLIVLSFQRHTKVDAARRVVVKASQRRSVKLQSSAASPRGEPAAILRVTSPVQRPDSFLNNHYHFEQTQVVRFIISTSANELRKCPNGKCNFSSTDANHVFSVPKSNVVLAGQTEPVQLQFSVRLHTFEGGRGSRADLNSYLFASQFVALARRDIEHKQGEVHVAEDTGNTLSWSIGLESTLCPIYKKAGVLGDGLAHVWRLLSDDVPATSTIPQVVVAFHGSDFQSASTEETLRNEMFALLDTDGVAQRADIPFHAKVASQYLRDYKSISNQLRHFLKRGSAVLVTGFSRASGMATIAAADLILDNSLDLGKVYGVTFGSPQVGDRSFLRLFRKFVRHSPRFGFFDRLVASDSTEKDGVKVDPEVAFPGAISEYMASYPAIKDIDCLRQYADVAALPRLAAGHLSMYVHVGRRVPVFQNGRELPPKDFRNYRRASLAMAIGSNMDILDMTAQFAKYPSTDRFDIYSERLRFAQNMKGEEGEDKSSPDDGVLSNPEHELITSARWLSFKLSMPDGIGATGATTRQAEGPACSMEHPGNEVSQLTAQFHQTKLAKDERLAADFCDGSGKSCQRFSAVDGSGLVQTTLSGDPVVRNENHRFAFHRPITTSLGLLKLRLCILKQARSPNCDSRVSSWFPPEYVTTIISDPFSLSDSTHTAGTIKLGGHEVSFDLHIPKNALLHLSSTKSQNSAQKAPSEKANAPDGKVLDLAENFFEATKHQESEMPHAQRDTDVPAKPNEPAALTGAHDSQEEVPTGENSSIERNREGSDSNSGLPPKNSGHNRLREVAHKEYPFGKSEGDADGSEASEETSFDGKHSTVSAGRSTEQAATEQPGNPREPQGSSESSFSTEEEVRSESDIVEAVDESNNASTIPENTPPAIAPQSEESQQHSDGRGREWSNWGSGQITAQGSTEQHSSAEEEVRSETEGIKAVDESNRHVSAVPENISGEMATRSGESQQNSDGRGREWPNWASGQFKAQGSTEQPSSTKEEVKSETEGIKAVDESNKHASTVQENISPEMATQSEEIQQHSDGRGREWLNSSSGQFRESIRNPLTSPGGENDSSHIIPAPGADGVSMGAHNLHNPADRPPDTIQGRPAREFPANRRGSAGADVFNSASQVAHMQRYNEQQPHAVDSRRSRTSVPNPRSGGDAQENNQGLANGMQPFSKPVRTSSASQISPEPGHRAMDMHQGLGGVQNTVPSNSPVPARPGHTYLPTVPNIGSPNSLKVRVGGNTGEGMPAASANQNGIEDHCQCRVLYDRGCLVPVPGTANKCIVEMCLKVRCSEDGTLQCNIRNVPQYVILGDSNTAVTNGQVDCRYEAQSPTPVLQ